MQKGILNGLKSLDRDFWKCFLRNPIGGFGIALLIVIVFVYDLLYELLVPARIKKEREARWKEDEERSK